jgi:hypothetical protein
MIACGRLLALSLGLVAATALAGCSSSSTKGVPDSKIIKALDMKSIGGNLAMQGNPFCSVTKLLNDASEVKSAASSGKVIASRDHTLGVVIVRPFAPSCKRFAERKLDKLTRPAGKKKHHKSKHGKKGGGGGG